MPIGAQYIYIFSFKTFIDQSIYILRNIVLLTINKCLIGFQRRKLSIAVSYTDYNIVLRCYFAIKFHSIK